MNRRNLLRAAASGACLCLHGAGSQPVSRVIVGFQPGGSSDFVGRISAQVLQDVLGQSYVVENRPGAGGRLALDVVRRASPDANTLGVAAQGAITLFPYVYKNLGYNPLTDLTPVSRLVSFDYALTVGPAVPARTLGQYVRWAQANPARASFASAGAGTTPHFVGTAFHRKIGVAAVHVPYKGTAPAIPDLISGRIPAMLATLSDSLQQHRSGSLRILAVAGAERSTIFPEAETFREAGIDLVVPGWMGLFGPRSMAPQIQTKLQEALQTGLNSPAVRAQLLTQGMFPSTTTSAALAALQRQEFEFWGPIVRDSGFTPED